MRAKQSGLGMSKAVGHSHGAQCSAITRELR